MNITAMLQYKRYVDVSKQYNGTYFLGGRRGRDRMVVGFTTTCAISAYHH
jgi:hypothetical protein